MNQSSLTREQAETIGQAVNKPASAIYRWRKDNPALFEAVRQYADRAPRHTVEELLAQCDLDAPGEKGDSAPPLMTPAEYDALVKLMRGSPESRANRTARLTLVNGMTQADAIRETGASRSAGNDAVARIKKADRLIKSAYVMKPESERV